jgi:membrane-associated phospholipid phosphatase
MTVQKPVQKNVPPVFQSMMKHLKLVIFAAICFTGGAVAATASEKTVVPPYHLFDNLGGNILRSAAFNDGTNFLAAGLGTWAFVETGADWQFRTFLYGHPDFSSVAYNVAMYPGYILTALTPFALYGTGFFSGDEKLQIAGLAVLQAGGIASLYHVIFTMATGRSEPHLVDHWHHTRIDTDVDFSGDFDWFKMQILDGWPSGHAMSSMAVASTLAHLYPEKPWVSAAAYSYAAVIGVGVAVSDHWVSDVIAGALMGYAIGTTTARSFAKTAKTSAAGASGASAPGAALPVTFSVTPISVSAVVRF